MTLAKVDTASMATSLSDLFDRVMSGQPYDEKQVKNATNLTNTIVKVLRFEFDVYKHFTRDAPGKQGRPAKGGYRTIADVAAWLRIQGDKVEKSAGVGLWVLNGRPCGEKDLVTRANNTRIKMGYKPFNVEGVDD